MGKKQILAGHHPFWLGNTHCRAVSWEKNVIVSQVGIEPGHAFSEQIYGVLPLS